MKYSMYDYYCKRDMNLYDIRVHYLEHFYYQNHSRNDAERVLRIVVDSTRINRLLNKSIKRRTMPDLNAFILATGYILKLMLRSNEAQVLAILDAALMWDIEINTEMRFVSSEELKNNIIEVFKKYSVDKTYQRELCALMKIPERKPNKEEVEGTGKDIEKNTKENTEENIEENTERSTEETERNVKELKEEMTVEKHAVPIDNKTLSEQKFKMKTWSLEAFIQDHGEMEVGDFENKQTGDTFQSCVFVNGNTKTFVAFSSKLGVLTPEEIAKMKDKLVVVQLPSGKYSLAKPKKSPWRRVDI